MYELLKAELQLELEAREIEALDDSTAPATALEALALLEVES